MRSQRFTVDIDRLVIDGLDVQPERADSIRRLAAQELQQLLRSGSGIGTSRVIGRAAAPPLMLAGGPVSEKAVAQGVAQRIAAALQESHHAL